MIDIFRYKSYSTETFEEVRLANKIITQVNDEFRSRIAACYFQKKRFENNNRMSTAYVIPFDDTEPQIIEGTSLIEIVIEPKGNGNFEIDGCVYTEPQRSGYTLVTFFKEDKCFLSGSSQFMLNENLKTKTNFSLRFGTTSNSEAAIINGYRLIFTECDREKINKLRADMETEIENRIAEFYGYWITTDDDDNEIKVPYQKGKNLHEIIN